MRLLLGLVMLAVPIAGGVAACGTDSSADKKLEPSGLACSGAEVHYNPTVASIFAAHCAGVEGCHVAMHDPSAAYAFLVGQPADECSDGRLMVDPSDPEHSYVIHKITDTNLCSGTPMPQAADWIQLPADQIQSIYDWICSGAKDD